MEAAAGVDERAGGREDEEREDERAEEQTPLHAITAVPPTGV